MKPEKILTRARRVPRQKSSQSLKRDSSQNSKRTQSARPNTKKLNQKERVSKSVAAKKTVKRNVATKRKPIGLTLAEEEYEIFGNICLNVIY